MYYEMPFSTLEYAIYDAKTGFRISIRQNGFEMITFRFVDHNINCSPMLNKDLPVYLKTRLPPRFFIDSVQFPGVNCTTDTSDEITFVVQELGLHNQLLLWLQSHIDLESYQHLCSHQPWII